MDYMDGLCAQATGCYTPTWFEPAAERYTEVDLCTSFTLPPC